MLSCIFYFMYYILAVGGICIAGIKTFRYEKKKWWYYVTAAGMLIGLSCISSFVSKMFAPILYGMEIVIYMLVATGKKSTRGFQWLCMFLLFTVFELSVTMVTQMGIGIELSKAATLTFNIFVVDVLIFILMHQKWYQNFMQYLEVLTIRQRISIVINVLAGVLMYGVCREFEGYITNSPHLYTFRVALVLFFVSTLWGNIWFIKGTYYSKFYYQQNQLKEEIISTQQSYYQTIYEKDRELRRFRHDISSHLGCINMLLDKQNMDDVKRYLHQMEIEFIQTRAYHYHVGDEILDTIINQMCMKADEKGIQVEVQGELQGQLEINPYDLCTIFSNAISNAIEACLQMEIKNPVVKVQIVCERNELLCRFINPATYEMYIAAKEKTTRKSDKKNHGFGVKNIEQAVERNKGEWEYLYENGQLILEIWI